MVAEHQTEHAGVGQGGCRGAGIEHGANAPGRTASAAQCLFVRDLVACALGIDGEAMRSATRQRAPVAYARQVAMYLAHVTCGLTLTDVGRAFGRDRTTVAHACQLIEDRRDETDTDLALEYMEAAIGAWLCRQGRCTAARPAIPSSNA